MEREVRTNQGFLVPWEARVATFASLPAPALGCAVAALLLGASLLLLWAFGFPILSRDGSLRSLTVNGHASLGLSALLGYAFAAGRYGFTATFRDLRAIGFEDPSIDPRVEPIRVFELPAEVLRASRYVGALGVLAALGFTAPGWRAVGLHPAAMWATGSAGVFALSCLFGWVVGRFGFFTVSGSRRTAGLTRDELVIDLFDLAPLRAFGRVGLRLSLIWIVGVSVMYVILLFDPNPEDVPPLLGPAYVLVTLLIAACALVLPVRGVQRRIHAAKRAELASVDRELRHLRDTDGQGRKVAPGHWADLLAHRSYVEAIREWPFDSATLRRFALYLLIPLVSWTGGALVERLLAAAFD